MFRDVLLNYYIQAYDGVYYKHKAESSWILLDFHCLTRSIHEVWLWYANACCNIKLLLDVIGLEGKGIRVRKWRIMKIWRQDEGSLEEWSKVVGSNHNTPKEGPIETHFYP